MRWNLSSSYLSLPDLFYTVQPPSPVTRPRLTIFNQSLAQNLGLGEWDGDLEVLAGNAPPPGVPTFAQAYAGHQYAHFTMLGDGRALVLGEHRDPEGRVFDVQLKGSGPTPYSRSGDGRAALGPMLREYLVGEAMHALGIPTTRGLSVVETGESVWRDGPLPGAVLARVAESHLRVGTFEFAAATGDARALGALTDYAIARHYPQAASAPNPGAAFLEAVVAAQARLVAQWMSVGFVHGVMNTDNMAISGQTIDYGPCAFLDTYRPGQVFSSIDRRGRYAYANQPAIAQWNLTRLAEALLPLLAPEEADAIAVAQPIIDGFGELYQRHYDSLMAAKVGLAPGGSTAQLVADLLTWMEDSGADFTRTFRTLTEAMLDGRSTGVLGEDPTFRSWYGAWRAMFDAQPSAPDAAGRMAAANPVYIPRNRKLQEALESAESGDLAPFTALLDVVSDPYRVRPDREAFETPPQDEVEPFVTYCGT